MLLFMFRRATAVAAGFALTACGGGDGGSGGGGGGGGANRPPVFTSATSVSFREESVSLFYQAVAVDPDGQPLNFTLSGPDAARFGVVRQTGSLAFSTSPNFENPGDANRDNVYEVTITVSDGSLSAQLDLRVTVTDVVGRASVKRFGAAFNQPLFLASLTDGTHGVYIVQKGGLVLIHFGATQTLATPLINLTSQVSTAGERGLLGFTLSPNFTSDRAFYVYLTNIAGDIEVRRYLVQTANPRVADVGTSDIILTIDHPNDTNHNGGWIGFGPDGFLYIATGDGGSTPNAAQDANSLLGKILRIDVSTDAFPGDPDRDYAIPGGNPFAGGGGAPEIWALGLRNPYRASIDPVTGDLFIGDVGENTTEEINRIRPTDGGANFGWPFFEGTTPFAGVPPGGFVHTLPVAQYTHGSGLNQGESIIGGYVHRGLVDELRGHYVFADYIDGHIWSVPETSLVPGATLASDQFILRDDSFNPDFGTIDNPLSFGTGPGGNLYVLDGDGDVFLVDVDETQ